MDMTKWNPLHELQSMTDRLNQVMRRSMLTHAIEKRDETFDIPEWLPAADIEETPKEFLVKVELPEVNKNDVKVSVENNALLIEGERKYEKEENDKKFHLRECSYGTFMRSFSLPDNVDTSKIQAEFKDGVLWVHLPKNEKAKRKAVEVKVH